MTPASEPARATPLRDQLRDDLVAGLTHALSNRVSTIGALVHWLQSTDEPPGQVAAMLADETVKLEEIVRLLRLLPAEERAASEAIHLPELLAETAALFRHHRALGGAPCVVDVTGELLPVWAPRAALRQALLLALALSLRGAASGARAPTIRCEGDAAAVVLSVELDAEPAADDARAVREAMQAAGAEVLEGGGARWAMRVTTLSEMRRRERERETERGTRR